MPDDKLEHVVVHPQSAGHCVVGVFLTSATLGEAERTAVGLCCRTLLTAPELHGWREAGASVALPRIDEPPRPGGTSSP
ncbi:hypothetical protein N566_04735 [Streptomycetaceae bacterium MP113-05]|nr:hypothetical protein N566_04735 [Streptomycetaceae bacterium MP113-05]